MLWMATRSPLLRIHDMLESVRGIEKALAGKTMRDYERSWLLRSAVERGVRRKRKPVGISGRATRKHRGISRFRVRAPRAPASDSSLDTSAGAIRATLNHSCGHPTLA